MTTETATPRRVEIGVPSETKQAERRVSIAAAGVRELTAAGHRVVVQAGAGEGAGVGASHSGLNLAGGRIVHATVADAVAA
ncbi:hypothetical protein [Patulibacter sp.]|uniref:hypothetical protein n=1 Tax=Patulibacter sp. TaxID=1912859 RepID=UPI0027159DBD|nr:hypothetical protein [Patulibacter sp.]MDO9409024.1 hypothetical protein [Patulibacter sp.]